jgi:hypothetical protein
MEIPQQSGFCHSWQCQFQQSSHFLTPAIHFWSSSYTWLTCYLHLLHLMCGTFH